MLSLPLLKILLLTSISFAFAFALTPILEHFLIKFKLGKNIRNDGTTPMFSALHAKKQGTPTMAGILIWFTVLFIATIFWILDRKFHLESFHILNFVNRKETLLPLGAFLGASVIGLLDDVFDLMGRGFKGRGFRFRHKLFFYILVAGIGAYWFYFKLGFDYLNIPFHGPLHLGWLYIPFFIFVVITTGFSVNQTDGLDGLAAGTLLFSFLGYGLIAYLEGKYNIAAFTGTIVGALLAFLWFNIFPAKFFMGDTGSMGLGTILAVIAFLIHGEMILPIIGIVFVLEALSTVLQLLWRKLFHKKLFLSAPLHHHLEMRGWPEAKVTMRMWIVSMIFSIMGVITYFISLTVK